MIGLTFLLFQLLYLSVFGVIIGTVAKLLYNGKNEPVGFLKTAALGIAGSYVGGMINFVLGSRDVISMSGLVLSIGGAILVMWIHDSYNRE